MNQSNKNISGHTPEISAMEAALAQLTPSVEPLLTDEIKDRVRAELYGESPKMASETKNRVADSNAGPQKVTIPLTHYIRIAQFNAAFAGLIAGLMFGVVLGGAAMFFLLGLIPEQADESKRQAFTPHAAMQQLLLDDPAFEQAWLGRMDRIEQANGTQDKEPSNDR